MNEIKMPQLSDSMEEGTILSWLVDDGQSLSEGDELVELETDKATMTYESEVSGVLQIVAAEGDTIPVGELIARIGPVEAADGSESPEAVASPAPEASITGDGGGTPAVPAAAGREPRDSGAEDPVSDSETAATPLARRIAMAHGIELDALTGSGPRGRITKADVLEATDVDPAAHEIPGRATAAAPSRSAPATAAASDHATAGQAEGARGASNRVELSRYQNVVARRTAEAKASIPHYQVQTEVNMDAAIELRSGFKAVGDGKAAPSFNDMIVKASALALREHPQVNGSFESGTYVLHERINIGIAVAAEDTLIVPTIFDADQKTLSHIGADSKLLAERVRSGKVTPPELSGGTFTVSNLGMYGMTAIFAVINPPESAILGVGAMQERLRRGENGEVVDSSSLTLTLSCDHRMLNGAEASRFLFQVKENLEQPLKLVL